MTPATIAAFKRGLEIGLVPSGWEQASGWTVWVRQSGRGKYVFAYDPTDLDIEAMEGKAGRVLYEAGMTIWYSDANKWWSLYDGGEREASLPGTKDEHLVALVAAVEIIKETK